MEKFLLVGVILALYEPFLKTRLENEGRKSGERFQHFSIKLYLKIYFCQAKVYIKSFYIKIMIQTYPRLIHHASSDTMNV